MNLPGGCGKKHVFRNNSPPPQNKTGCTDISISITYDVGIVYIR